MSYRNSDGLATILIVVGVAYVVFLFFKYAVKAGVKGANDERRIRYRRSPLDEEAERLDGIERMRTKPTSARSVGFPVQPVSGRFRVKGVDRESKMDCSSYYVADSEANARVKAELDGMVVTSVEWVGEE